jgi:hypothetical protein
MVKYKKIDLSFTSDVLERFTKKYEVRSTGCWEWVASKTRGDYGTIGIRPSVGGRHIMARAHRVSYTLHKGDCSDFNVCHSCDNPCCVNPEHLFLGSTKDNVADRQSKGRHARGHKAFNNKGNPKYARVSEDIVKKVRLMYSDGIIKADIARQCNLHPITITRIINKSSWSWVGE